MGCTSSAVLAGIAYDCSDIPVGGLKTVYITKLEDVVATISADDLTAVTIGLTKTAELEFNNKDGFSAYTDEKTVEPSGLTTAVPTVVIEFPKMTKTKRDELNTLATAGLDLVAWVETAAGTLHAIGLEYGARVTLVSGASGTGRSEKNMYQLTITGEEDVLAYDASTVWADVVASLI